MKKLFAILMSVMMIACFMPTMAFAATTPEATPNVTFTAIGYNTGKLTDVSAGLKYKIGEGNWVDIDSDAEVSLTDLEPCTIQIVKKATDTDTMEDSAAQEIQVTRADKPTSLQKTDPAAINGKGTIATTTAHEYSTDTSETKTYSTCSENMQVEPGTTYYIRVAATGTVLASESQDYTVNAFTATKEETPNASFEAKGADNGILSNVASGMKYSLNDTDWVDIEGDSVTIASGVTTAGIKVIKKGNGTTTLDSATQTITVSQQAKPTGVEAVNCTAAGNDGKLTGVTTAMEYQKDGDIDWQIISDTTVEGLAAGTYYVRTKAVDTALASTNLTVEIKGYPTASATVPEVINGTTTVELKAQDITITLTSAQLRDVTEGKDVSAWFDTLPAGLKATVKEVTGNTEVIVTISGTPTKEGNYTAEITIPNGNLTQELEDGGLPVANNVVFSIAKYYHVVTGGGGGGSTQPTQPSLDTSKTTSSKAITDAAAANKYDEAEQAEVKKIVDKAAEDIKNAKTVDEVKAIEAAAKKDIDKILTTDEKAAIAALDGVEKRDLQPKSKVTKLKGKRAIKLTWTAPEGVKVDGYEIFRSTKKNSGYGLEPYFETPKTSYTNSKEIKSGKTYYYKVRAYVEINGERHYTDFSLKTWKKAK